MTALEKIKQIGTFTESQLISARRQGVDYEELEYMLRAFKVMREITGGEFDLEFEKRMNEKE